MKNFSIINVENLCCCKYKNFTNKNKKYFIVRVIMNLSFVYKFI